MRKGRRIVKWVGIIYILSAVLLYFFQHKIIFQPETLPEKYVYHFDKPFKEIFIETPDGEKLNGIHFSSENPKGVILYFHGNRGNLQRWGKICSFFVDKGYEVIVMDYRSYGKSTGSITEQLLYEDAQLFYEYAKEKYAEENIIMYGRSLGTGIAAKIASDNQPGNLVLETPYFSMSTLSANKVPVLPVKLLLKYEFPSHKFLKSVTCPVTIYHGTDDEVVPHTSGKKLYDSMIDGDKEMITIQDGKHNNIIQFDEYLNTIDRVLGK